MNWGTAIRRLRGLAAWSQTDLAREAGVHPTFVSLIEGGQRIPSLEVIEKIATVLGIPMWVLAVLADPKVTKDQQVYALAALRMNGITEKVS